ncbi:Thymidylate kinase [Amycolatopsis azurea DSM 43854]|uniref:Thymidylate kinase n=1 Tax=Amycolatopsis azurea DSM 43854 TaxID=1238180 RepID=M2NID9_9PSEU|nr:Thymidylate kinase [Amycolatopsis azurea DSM 43854]
MAVAGPDAASRADLLAAAVASLPDGAVVVSGAPDADGVPLLAGRPLVEGAAAAYVCRGYVCERPVTTAEDLRAQLRAG